MAAPGQRQITVDEAWQITCHEAGHAVVAVRFVFNFHYVERGEGEHGKMEPCGCPLNHRELNWPLTAISQWQQWYAAGVAAEWLLFGKDSAIWRKGRPSSPRRVGKTSASSRK